MITNCLTFISDFFWFNMWVLDASVDYPKYVYFDKYKIIKLHFRYSIYDSNMFILTGATYVLLLTLILRKV